MENATVVVGIDKLGEKILSELKERYKDDLSKGWLAISCQEEEGAEFFLINGDGPSEIRDDFLKRREDFLSLLGSYYQSFQIQNRGIESLRYLLFCPLDSPSGISLPLEVARLIRYFHKELISFPCEIEAFLIFPNLNAEDRVKALSYAALKQINHFQSSNRDDSEVRRPLFDFVWLCEHLRTSLLPVAFPLYLESKVQNDFNTSARNTIFPKSFLGKHCGYSSLGAFNLVFSWKEMIDLLKSMLEADILSTSPLKISKLDPSELETLTQGFEGRLRRYELEERRLSLKEKKIEVNVEFFLREFEKEGSETIDSLIDDIYRRVDILFERGKEKVIDTDIKDWREEYFRKVRNDAEELMDSSDAGIYVSKSFLSYVLGDEGFYNELGKPPLPDIKNLYNLSTILVHQIKEEALGLIKSDLDEIIERLSTIYGRYEIPSILWRGVERTPIESLIDTEATIDFSKFTEEDRVKVSALKEIREIILSAIEEVDNLLGEDERWQIIFTSLEAFTKEKARQKLSALKELKEKMERARAEPGEQKQKRKPLLFGRKKYKKSIKNLTGTYEFLVREYEEGKKAFSAIVMDRKNFIFQQRLILDFHNQLSEATSMIKREIEGFIHVLKERKWEALEWINEPHFLDDEVTFNVAKAHQAKIFYPEENELPSLFEDFYKVLHETKEPKLSPHYRHSGHFINKLGEFSFSQFQRLKVLSIEEVMSRLDNYQEALTTMNTNCRVFANIKSYPNDLVSTMLYIGVEDESRTHLKKEDCLNSIQGSYQIHSTGEKHLISGLRITHGITLFALEGIRDLRNSYEKIVEEEDELLKEYERYDDLIPEELE